MISHCVTDTESDFIILFLVIISQRRVKVCRHFIDTEGKHF